MAGIETRDIDEKTFQMSGELFDEAKHSDKSKWFIVSYRDYRVALLRSRNFLSTERSPVPGK